MANAVCTGAEYDGSRMISSSYQNGPSILSPSATENPGRLSYEN